MKRPRIYVTAPIHPDAQARLAEHCDVDVGDERLPLQDIRRRVAGVSVILSKTDPLAIDRDLIDAAPGLRLVARHGSGYSNVDVDYATRRGVAVTNTPGANAVSLAEYTLGLMFATARRLVPAAAAARCGDPDRMGLMGIELAGKTLGIVGVGHIGREVAQRAHALGLTVLGHHPRPSARRLAGLPVELVGLDRLLTESDVVSLHVPLTNETRGMIGPRELALMKERAILLNLSRGGVVDEQALFDVLAARRIFAAATDVLAHEPVRSDEPLLQLDNCLVLPHIGAVTNEGQRAVALAAVGEVVRWSRGEPLTALVNPEVLQRAEASTGA